MIKVTKSAQCASLAVAIISMIQVASANDFSSLDQPEQVKSCLAKVQKELLEKSKKAIVPVMDVRIGLGLTQDNKKEIYTTYTSFDSVGQHRLGHQYKALVVIPLDVQKCTLGTEVKMVLWTEKSYDNYKSQAATNTCPVFPDGSDMVVTHDEWREKPFLRVAIGKVDGQKIHAQEWYDSESGQPVVRVAREKGCTSYGAGGPSQMYPINQALAVDCGFSGQYCQLRSKGEVSIGNANEARVGIATNSSKLENHIVASEYSNQDVRSLTSTGNLAQ